jgi:hypothetical protein
MTPGVVLRPPAQVWSGWRPLVAGTSGSATESVYGPILAMSGCDDTYERG